MLIPCGTSYARYWSLPKDLQLVRDLSALRSILVMCASSKGDHCLAARCRENSKKGSPRLQCLWNNVFGFLSVYVRGKR